MSPHKERSLRTLPIFLICLAAIVAFSNPQDQLADRYDAARLAWDTGDFVRALEEFQSILKSPDGGRFFEPIALLTGELFQVTEITKDGRSIRVSPDGKYAAYDAGTRGAPLTRIVALRKEIEALTAQPAPDRQVQTAKQRQLTWLEAKNAPLFTYDIAAKKEKPVKAEGLLKSGLVWSADGKEIYFAGAKETDTAANEIYSVSPAGTVKPLTSGPGFKTNPVVIPGGKYLIYTPAAAAPFPRPAPPAPAGKPGAVRPQEQTAAAASLTVGEPRARLTGFSLKKDEKLAVAVKAVNGRGIQSWDWMRTTAGLGK